MEGHVEGMLDRDQRTAKLRFFDHQESSCCFQETAFRSTSSGTPNSSRPCCCPTRTRRFKPSQLACRNGYLLNTFQSVKNVLVVVCITLVAIPVVNCRPMEKFSEEPKWVNPCGGTKLDEVVPNSNFNRTELDALNAEAHGAFNKALEVTRDHMENTFKKPMEKVHHDLKGKTLEWLGMNLPKLLNETVEEGHFDNMKIEDVLTNVYSLLQRIAVGLEQITHDQSQREADSSKFNDMEHQMRRLLCELKEMMEAHGRTLPEDVKREIMKAEDREGDDTTIKNRDYIILRDYMNTLQYISMALEHYRNFVQS